MSEFDALEEIAEMTRPQDVMTPQARSRKVRLNMKRFFSIVQGFHRAPLWVRQLSKTKAKISRRK